jgi:hypothetical protein
LFNVRSLANGVVGLDLAEGRWAYIR